jgi:hypothetical protein
METPVFSAFNTAVRLAQSRNFGNEKSVQEALLYLLLWVDGALTDREPVWLPGALHARWCLLQQYLSDTLAEVSFCNFKSIC